MIRNRLFGKYYLFMALVVLIFVAIGFFASRLVTRFSPSPVEDHHAVFYAHLIDTLGNGNRPAGLQLLKKLNPTSASVHLKLVDANGQVIDPPGVPLNYEWAAMQKPTVPYAFETIRAPFRTVVLLPGEPPQYLSVASERTRSLATSTFFSTTFAALAVSVLLGIACSMIVLFYSLRGKAALADSVLADLQRGNLKARFPIGRMDEIGQAMSRFNTMASEIERLVEQLKSIEQSRMRLLQELAHDLRTPVASLRNLLETVSSAPQGLDSKLKAELLSLSLTEVDYFERLVEDLLTLAQVSEPRYHEGRDLVSLGDLLDEEAENVATANLRDESRNVALVKNVTAERLCVRGDSHLLRRMLRNALDNAYSFARGEVVLTVQREGDSVLITIDDDGPGFTSDALVSYGERRSSRVVKMGSDTKRGERLSVGLGSVIIKTVTQTHRGRLEASNGGRNGGARVSIRLPLAS